MDWGRFEFVTQKGRDTGNDELEDFVPEQVQIRGSSAVLVLQKRGDRWVSGKIRSRQNLTELLPNGGSLEVVVQGVNSSFHRGIWPAVWLLPHGRWPQGGEIDLYEQMYFHPGDERKAFSTCHFGRDKDYRGGAGLNLARYNWSPSDQKLRFEWRREGVHWRLSMFLNGELKWSFSTDGTGVMDVAGFNPAAIFQRCFDDPQHGLYLVCNLSYGGRPFGPVSGLELADFVIKSVTVT
jgi:hypothetical protein